MPFFVGIDWASAAHAVCVLDETAHIHWQGSVPHTAEGLTEFLQRLRSLCRRGPVQVALERPSGLLVDTLLEAAVRLRRLSWQGREVPLEPAAWERLDAGPSSPQSGAETHELLTASGISLSDSRTAALYRRTEGWLARAESAHRSDLRRAATKRSPGDFSWRSVYVETKGWYRIPDSNR